MSAAQKTHTLPLAFDAMLHGLAEARRAVPVPCRKADVTVMLHDVPAVAALAAFESGGELDTRSHGVKIRHESGAACVVLWISHVEKLGFYREVVRAKMPRVAERLIDAAPTVDTLAALVEGYLATEGK